MSEVNTSSTYMDSQEAADFLRISTTALYNLRRNKGLPFVKLGKKVLYSREQMLEFMKKQTQIYQ